jgi:hypothetical protein
MFSAKIWINKLGDVECFRGDDENWHENESIMYAICVINILQ